MFLATYFQGEFEFRIYRYLSGGYYYIPLQEIMNSLHLQCIKLNY